MAHRAEVAVAASFAVFLVVRLVALSVSFGPLPLFPAYVDGVRHYIPAGIAYVKGASVDSVNFAHPPLAKDIIGIFALYAGNPTYSSLIFNFLSAVLAFLLARKLTGSSIWATVTVWLLTFDMVTVGVAITPMLESFTIFFGLLGLWLALAANKSYAVLCGFIFGLGIASKWSGLFFAVPAVVFLVCERRYSHAAVLPVAGFIGYLLPYTGYIATNGFRSFVGLQLRMYDCLYGTQALGANAGSTLIARLAASLLFHTTTYVPVTGFDPRYHPEGFTALGCGFISLSNQVSAPIVLLLIPVLCLEVSSFLRTRTPIRLLLLLVLASFIALEIARASTDYLFPWHFAPIIAVLTILGSDLFKTLWEKMTYGKIVTFAFFELLAVWPLVADAITIFQAFHAKAFQ